MLRSSLRAAFLVGMAVLACSPRVAAAQRPLDPPIDYSYLGLPSDFTTQLRQGTRTYEGSYFDRYAVRMRAGQVATVTVESSEFDPKLLLGPLGDRYGYTDDDGGGGTSARLSLYAERDTTIVVMVYSYGARQTGTYRIRISEPPRMPDSGRWGGDLEPNDASMYDEEYGDVYLAEFLWFDARAGERITFNLASPEFDAFLYIRAPGGDVLASDDDSGGDTDARLEFTAPTTGRYLIQVTSSFPEEVGAYTLGMARVQVATAPSGTDVIPVSIGASVRGEISPGDSRDCGQYPPCDRYVFDARAGDRLSITMVRETTGIDPVLTLLDASGAQVANNDDDPNNGRNARIDVTIPATGRYRIIARSFAGSGSAPYVLSVQRSP